MFAIDSQDCNNILNTSRDNYLYIVAGATLCTRKRQHNLMNNPHLVTSKELGCSVHFVSGRLRVRRVVLKADVVDFQAERPVVFVSGRNAKVSYSLQRYRLLLILDATFAGQEEP